MNITKKIIHGGALNLAAFAITVGVALGATPLYFKGLGQKNYGLYGLLASCYAVLNLLNLGTSEATMRFLAGAMEDPGSGKARKLAGLMNFGYLATGALGFLILASGAWWDLGSRLGLPADEAAVFSACLVAAAFSWLAQYLCLNLWNYYKVYLDFRCLALSQIAVALALPFFCLAALRLGGGLPYFLLAQATVYLLAAIAVGAWILRRRPALPLAPRFDAGSARQVLAYSSWSTMSQASVFLSASADKFFLARLGAAPLAAYSIGIMLTQKAMSVPQILAGTLFPVMAKIDASGSPARVRRAYGLAMRGTSLVCFCLFVPLAAGGPAFIARWIGPEAMLNSEDAFLLLCAGAFFGGLSMVYYSTLMGLGYARLWSVTALMSGLISLGVMIAAVPAWGLKGAALGCLAGYGTMYFVRLVLVEIRVFKSPVRSRLMEALLFLLASLAATLVLRRLAASAAEWGLARIVAVGALSSLVLFAAGMAGDHWISKRGVRRSLFEALRDTAKA